MLWIDRLVRGTPSSSEASTVSIAGRLVVDGAIRRGRVEVENGVIASVEFTERGEGPLISPGLVDIHVHGACGEDVMSGREALARVGRFLLRHGVTSFLPTSVSAPISEVLKFAATVRDFAHDNAGATAQALGVHLEGPYLSTLRKGAQNEAHILAPSDVPFARIGPMADVLRLVTVAPELPGAREFIAAAVSHSVAISLGHSTATADEANAGFNAGARSTTHLFNAMTGIDHHHPGLAAVALARDDVYVELIADGEHVDRTLWSTVWRTKPADRLILVSDAVSLAGLPGGHAVLGGLPVEIANDRAVLSGTDTLAGSLLSLDAAVHNVVAAGLTFERAIQAVTENPLRLIGVGDRGTIRPGLRADLVSWTDDLRVERVMLGGTWFDIDALD